ncbi:DsbC family protein [Desulfuromonas acetoxidans]|uniref:DsbC family protein n=1 Tax=Desulfuromonas acetoxidans TaxID=891 RepID=UPI001593C16D|nr:DsbC family protein [Desulfuromonas acetoxidans]MBF0644758.1 DsbC family protein [Desulfuromonas acetoxidans]NVD25242.1 DsbC family protein [Desulfuromonas acetoxidans]NVE17354.1 DsbC family protein [Desulfuromonas acetoxidans]
MWRNLVLVICVSLFLPAYAWSFGGDGCGAGECKDCHSLTKEEAFKLLPPGADRVDSVEFSDVGGLWEIKGEARGRMFTVFIDFSKEYLVSGRVVRISDGTEISRKINMDEIRSEGALLLGREDAPVKAYVFTDAKCGHCRKLHQELKKVIAQQPKIAFYIKVMAMLSDTKLTKDIVCSGSHEVLEQAMADQPVPENACTTNAVEETLAFAKKWQIRSTPTMVLPDGHVLMGARPAEELIKELSVFLPKE